MMTEREAGIAQEETTAPNGLITVGAGCIDMMWLPF